MNKNTKIQSASINQKALKKVKVSKKDTWRFRGSIAGSIDIEPLL